MAKTRIKKISKLDKRVFKSGVNLFWVGQRKKG